MALNGRRMSPRMPNTFARSRLPLISACWASASSSCSRVGNPAARGVVARRGPEVLRGFLVIFGVFMLVDM
ncbi:hypothetical protein D3C87_1967840 [compost metagenome]